MYEGFKVVLATMIKRVRVCLVVGRENDRISEKRKEKK